MLCRVVLCITTWKILLPSAGYTSVSLHRIELLNWLLSKLAAHHVSLTMILNILTQRINDALVAVSKQQI